MSIEATIDRMNKRLHDAEWDFVQGDESRERQVVQDVRALLAEVKRLRTLAEAVASAFEPDMDSELAGDERAAVRACRVAAEAAGGEA